MSHWGRKQKVAESTLRKAESGAVNLPGPKSLEVFDATTDNKYFDLKT